MTEDELSISMRANGMLPDGKGGWFKPKRKQTSTGTDIQRGSGWKVAELERAIRHGTLVAASAKKGAPRNVLVRVTSVRRFLLDDDNLCEKFHVDRWRYAAIIHGDSPATTRIEVAQVKAGPDKREYVKIEIYQL